MKPTGNDPKGTAPRICVECGEEIPRNASSCPHCDAARKRNLFIKCGLLLLIPLALVVYLMMTPNTESNTDAAQCLFISYDVLYSSRTDLHILVPERSTKEEIIELANRFTIDFKGKRKLIYIFDSEEAYRKGTNEAEPDENDEDYEKHRLMTVNIYPEKELTSVRWLAEDRDH